jgi:23S rRNA pseudouridine955/2504/2580 synthase
MSGVTQRDVQPAEAGIRLDRWFRQHFPGLGHGRLEKLLRTGQIRVDGRRAKAGQRLEAGQALRIPPLGDKAAETVRAARHAPSEADQRLVRSLVLYRDDAVIAINKPAGLAVQGGAKMSRHLDGMLDGLRFGSDHRPRLVHRLDRDTSGVLLLARSAAAARALTAGFRGKEAAKLYWAATIGVPDREEGMIDLALAKRAGAGRSGGEAMTPDPQEGRKAVTAYRVIDHVGSRAAVLALWPKTGRTHQLRVHCAAIGHPILGDGKYGGAAAFLGGVGIAEQLHLHARRIVLPHPDGHGHIDVTAPLSDHMAETWKTLGFSTDSAEFDNPYGPWWGRR